MSYLHELHCDGYGDPTVPMPELTSDAKLRIIRSILWLDPQCADEDPDSYWNPTPAQQTRKVLQDMIGSAYDDDCYVVVYESGSAYGGPEEGGWYYSADETQYAVKVVGDDWAQILDHAEAMAERLNDGMRSDRDTDSHRFFGREEPQRWAQVELHPQRAHGDRSPIIGCDDIIRSGRPHYC
jgi:hypothetical protein